MIRLKTDPGKGSVVGAFSKKLLNSISPAFAIDKFRFVVCMWGHSVLLDGVG